MVFAAGTGGINATALPQSGVGPGGGPGYFTSSYLAADAAAGSFGSVGAPILILVNDTSPTNATAPVYGDLTGTLQGGSGGGCGCSESTGLPSNFEGETGSGGGGALEIGAAGLLEIGPAAILQANGAALSPGTGAVFPGGGRPVSSGI
jgi:hypothetical protein